MAAVGNTTPIRELSDAEIRKKLLTLGYDVPVSVNREFLVRKLENASATAVGGGGGGKPNKRHSMAVTPSASPKASPNTARKRKSMAATSINTNGSSDSPGGTPGRGDRRGGHSNVNSTPISPLASASAMSPPRTPQYAATGNVSLSNVPTPATPPPYVSRLGTPSSPNGETGGGHSPRYMSYYNMFKANSDGDAGLSTPSRGGGDGANYGYPFNRSIRMSAPAGGSFSPVTSVAPPSKSDRNGYAGGATGNADPDWNGGILISKMLVGLFILFFVIIAGAYIRTSMLVDPRGLTGSSGIVNESPSSKQTPPTPAPPPKKAEPPIMPSSMIYPICGMQGVDPEACIPKDIVKNSRILFNALKDELTQRAKRKGCFSDANEIVSLHEAKTILHKLTDLNKRDIDSAFNGMLLLVTENKRGGLSLVSEAFSDNDISSKDVPGLEEKATKIFATNINPDFICGIVAFLTSMATAVAVGAGTAGAGYICWKGFHYYQKKKKSEEDEIFVMVEKVIEVLGRQYELSETTQGTAYLAVNHIRDELMPPKERQKKDALWTKVVDYISNHESRVREEIQHISGEEFKVWRWLPTASPRQSAGRYSTPNSAPNTNNKSRFSMPIMSSSPMPSTSAAGLAGPSVSPIQKSLYPSLSGMNSVAEEDELLDGSGEMSDNNSNNKWQGQAFETCEGSVNSLPSTPTTCLKIRHMFTERDAKFNGRSRIEQEILGKCRNAKILHIGIEPSSVEGCVYIRCLSKEDARKAFMSLHGWWFDGHLLSVKFLKEDRYFSRFPEARNCTIPMVLPS